MFRRMILLAAPLSLLSLLYFAGCGSQGSGDGTATPAKNAGAQQHSDAKDARGEHGQQKGPREGEHAAGDEHEHKPGAHGGMIVAIGRDNYHAEAVFEKGGALRIYLLGKDEANVKEVESQSLNAYARSAEGGESTSFPLNPEPQSGDAEGKTSVFVGTLPEELRGKSVSVTIPSIRINGERFRFAVQMTVEHHDEAMPAKVNDAEEEALYLTPGGIYTEADIKANGSATASKRFKGVASAHDLKPKSGDKICPVTLTKANPKFTWVVGGKTYEFCCPPCVDEFVKTAKEHPEEIKAPQEYVKQ